MISRNYFFSGKVLRGDKLGDEYRTMYYYTTKRTWLDDSAGALRYCIEEAKKEASERGYHGPLIIRAFNRI